ncbi:MAG: peptide-methionine (S)-S-oxide reductase MsrA [Bdellovibrionales bacterium]|nr:peptide-methionine (S)-S-oxide reductase MsrA [Bdellovibrionales bacterium]
MTEKKASVQTSTAILGGGCFWGVEELLRTQKGVTEIDVGYSGGESKDPTYNDVKTGTTGHAEVVRVVFDPKILKYADLLRLFFRLHDPTTLNRQGNDRGTQYRSVIFYQDEEQKKIAEEVRNEVSKSGKWKNPVITEISKAKPFYRAEEYHQDYLVKNPNGYTCHYWRD